MSNLWIVATSIGLRVIVVVLILLWVIIVPSNLCFSSIGLNVIVVVLIHLLYAFQALV